MAETARATSAAPSVQSDAHRIPFADDAFDTVLALWMLYHVDDKPTALREIGRTLRPGGLLVASTNSGALEVLDHLVIDALLEQVDGPIDHWHAPLSFTSESGEDILRTAFTEVEVHPFGNTFTVRDTAVVVRYVGSMLDAIQAEHGDLDTVRLLSSIGRAVDEELEANDAITIDRAGTVFLARA